MLAERSIEQDSRNRALVNRPGGKGGNGPPEGKFMKLGGKFHFGVLSSKMKVIRAKRGPSASF